MPHKRNPITSERMAGMARLLRGYAQVGLENVALWHERDISHSSAERVVLPDASLILHYMLATFSEVVAGLVIDTARMQQNLEATGGFIYSQKVLHALIDAGQSRDAAYRLVQKNANVAREEGIRFADAVAKDPEVTLTAQQIDDLFSPLRLLEESTVIWSRLDGLQL